MNSEFSNEHRIMTEIRFYHLQKETLEDALPKILVKAHSAGHKAVVRLRDSQEVERINKHLWTFRQRSFLPHGSKADGHAEDQPIWLTDGTDRPNDADVLVLTQSSAVDQVEDYKLCCDLFDGNDENAVKDARQRWKNFKEKDFKLTYWQQDDSGKWEEKASA